MPSYFLLKTTHVYTWTHTHTHSCTHIHSPERLKKKKKNHYCWNINSPEGDILSSFPYPHYITLAAIPLPSLLETLGIPVFIHPSWQEL
jgi:hypothetical protein